MITNIRNIKVDLMYKGHNQLKITFDHTLHTYDWDKCEMVNLEKEGGFFNIYQVSFYSLYHNLAKECNRVLGTNFEYSQELIDKVKFVKMDMYNIGYEYNWAIRENVKGKIYEILHHYWYDGNSKTFIGLGGINTATYGEYDKDSIIAIVSAIKKALDKNNIDKMIYEELKKHTILTMKMVSFIRRTRVLTME